MSLFKESFKHKTTEQNKPGSIASGKSKRKLFLLIGGIVLIAAALFFIVQAVYNILEAELLTDTSLQEAKQLVAELRPPEGQRATSASNPNASPNGSENAVSSPDLSTAPGPLINRPAGEVLGYLIFNSLNGREVPVIEGAEPAQLKKGAGHHEDMAYPGQSGNCLLFGHRNTVFRDFGNLKINDTIQIKTSYGTFTYTINDMQITEPLNPLMFKGYTEPYLTLVTCYPFHYVGNAPKRYVVVCKQTGKN